MIPRSRALESLTRLRSLGFCPTGIIDAGAFEGHFSRGAREVFAGASILMIDALAENDPVLTRVGSEIGNATHVIAMLGERDVEASSFFVVDTALRPDLVKTGSSMFKENTSFPMDERLIPQRRLETIVADRDLHFQFIKLDVQGAEVEVLRGLGDRMRDVEILLIEMSLVEYNKDAPLMHVVMNELAALGFVLLDLVEEHRYRDGALLQVDGIFVRPDSLFRPKPPFWN